MYCDFYGVLIKWRLRKFFYIVDCIINFLFLKMHCLFCDSYLMNLQSVINLVRHSCMGYKMPTYAQGIHMK